MICDDKPKGELGREWMEAFGTSEFYGLRIGNPMERPGQQTRLEKRQGLTVRARLFWEVWFSIRMTQEQSVLRGHGLWSLMVWECRPFRRCVDIGWMGRCSIGLWSFSH